MNPSSKTSTDTDQSGPPEVVLIPAALFFIERIEVPTAVAAEEIPEFAELSLEGVAPFPLEQLRWGFLTEAGGREIIIYAALVERLKAAGFGDLSTATWVLPDFAALYTARFSEPVTITLRLGEAVSTIQHPGGEGLPRVIRAGANGSATPLLGPPEGDAEAPPPARLELQLEAAELDDKDLPKIHFSSPQNSGIEGHWSGLSLPEAILWQADVRPLGVKAEARKRRRLGGLIARATGYAAALALLLLLLEGFLFAGQLWLQGREDRVDAQATAVRRIQDKESLMTKLDQVAQNELRPIAILDAANRVRVELGSTGIEYDEVVIEGGNRLTIEGKANTINELNAYTTALSRSGNFTIVDEPRYITRSGRTTFTTTLDYRHRPEGNATTATPEGRETRAMDDEENPG